MHHIDIIKQTVGDTIPLKVAGGVRDLNTLLEMKAKGVSRFGIGYKSAIQIMEQCESI
jgi:deoxyribose-phosphate aldolase